jgi:hypothetical protein
MPPTAQETTTNKSKEKMETTQDTSTHELGTPHRPQFLTVLCILTWVSCGLLFIMTVWGIAFKPSAEERYEQIEKMREVSPETADQMEVLLQKQDEGGQLMGTALNLVALLLSAYGAYLMWQLKRSGFYFYVAGELVPYLGFVTGGAEAMSAISSMGGGAGLATAIIGIMIFLDVLFIGLYAANLKHLRR